MVHKSNYEFRKRGYAPLLTSQVSKKKKKNYLENRKRAGTLKNDQSSTTVILLANISSKVPAGPTNHSELKACQNGFSKDLTRIHPSNSNFSY